MSTNGTATELADASERERAVGTFDRNLVVTAGAGTGKTTLLVDRLVHLLLRNPEPLRITEIVALTFTNKAANEIKLRLRERLQAYIIVKLDRQPANDAEGRTHREIKSLVARYQLSKNELDARVEDALRNMERSDIGTIHSFAATLLRLYPLEGGVDPQFKEDDGKQFERVFDEQWDLWLDQELALAGTHGDDWRKILRRLTLDQIKALAQSLCSETVELVRADPRPQEAGVRPIFQNWLANLESRAVSLIAVHAGNRQNEKLVRAARAVIREFRQRGSISEHDSIKAGALVTEKSINKELQDWTDTDVIEAQELVRIAKGLVRVDAGLTRLLWDVLVPFVEKFREFFVHEGFVSFDGLLMRARNLVRDRPHVREELKRQFRAILIDEFQDTDPIQYEVLLYLAEQIGRSAKDWRNVKLTAGKIFVVGDPKQSIYAFRRADIEAYLEVVEKVIMTQNGMECHLTTNFRSDAAILEVVNGVFESLIQPQAGVQPTYIAIHPAPERASRGTGEPNSPLLPRVMVRKIVADDADVSAEKARRIEGQSLARWIKDELLERTRIFNSSGERVRAQPKDVAILFRKLTDIHDYLEPLRQCGIRYVVEGERHFYATKEIIDAVNLLRAIENPYDRLALVGVLRSPLGGLSDQTLYELHRENLLDYRKVARLKESAFPETLTELYRELARLHEEIPKLPVGAAVSHIFSSLPLRALAACSFHGEQAVANLEKLRQQAEALGREGLTTLKETIHELQQRVLDVKEEGESVLAEENLDAVRIMSIHKAKGLEFPIVILAGCQTGTDARRTLSAEALFDWSTGLTGIRVGRTWDLAGLYIAEKSRLRAKEEQKRVLYVAMTRAREHLIISCAPSARRTNGSFLAMLDESCRGNITAADESSDVAIGNGRIELRLVSASLGAPGGARRNADKADAKPNWQSYVETWDQRRENYQSTLKTPVFVTPTLLKRQEQDLAEAPRPKTRSSKPRTPQMIFGELAHRFLEAWDFAQDPEKLSSALGPFLDHWLPSDLRKQRETIQAELAKIFAGFFGSSIYAELARSQILGREVPLLMRWDGQIMEGIIDLIYEHDGLLYLADYKTDRVAREELIQATQRYERQAQVYAQAAQQSLERKVAAFKVIFLRLGEAVHVPPYPYRALPLQLRLL